MEAVAPLRDLWRSVYRKAAELAEARTGALLDEHRFAQHGRRALCVVLDGGGADLTTGPKCDVELPWAYALEGWALYADAAGSAVVDLQAPLPPAAWPTVVTVCGATPPTLAAAAQARSEDVAGWRTALPRGTVLRVDVLTATTVRRVTLTLFVRAL